MVKNNIIPFSLQNNAMTNSIPFHSDEDNSLNTLGKNQEEAKSSMFPY